jgi:Zn-dependent protease
MDLLLFLERLSAGAIPILMAITLHEVAHGRVARHFGDRTADSMGRLSLNPLRHIDAIGTVLVPAVLLWMGGPLFGWAKPVPVNPRNLGRPRKDMVWVAAAGPIANVGMAIGWAILLSLVQHGGSTSMSDWLVSMAATGVVINLLLAVFNMLPIPPLDGGRVLANLVPPGPVSRLLAQIEPFGLFIVFGLLIWGGLWTILGGPIDLLTDFVLALVGAQRF